MQKHFFFLVSCTLSMYSYWLFQFLRISFVFSVNQRLNKRGCWFLLHVFFTNHLLVASSLVVMALLDVLRKEFFVRCTCSTHACRHYKYRHPPTQNHPSGVVVTVKVLGRGITQVRTLLLDVVTEVLSSLLSEF